MSPESSSYCLSVNGFALLHTVVPMDMVDRLRADLGYARGVCREWQHSNGLADITDGTVHHLPALSGCHAVHDFLETNPAGPHIERYFGGPYILNSMGGNFNEGRNYASEIHRDIRSYQEPCPLLNTLVMLDDFTERNGATWVLPGRRLPNKPSGNEFCERAVQIVAPVGSILMWDSNLWHRAGENKTGKPRRIMTPIYSKPWFKQGMDYPRAVGYDEPLSDTLRQILGYNARVPATFDEWYRKPEERFYRSDQG